MCSCVHVTGKMSASFDESSRRLSVCRVVPISDIFLLLLGNEEVWEVNLLKLTTTAWDDLACQMASKLAELFHLQVT